MSRGSIFLLATIVLAVAVSGPEAQPQVWTHGELAFTKADFADWTLAGNQDRITDQVWITRQNTQGIFNIRQESAYDKAGGSSPLGTEWAVGSIENWDTLDYVPFIEYANFKVGDNILSLGPSVVHLIDEDIYVAIEFTSWTGSNQGGGFSYTRTTFDPSPVQPSTWGAIKALYR